MTSPPGFPSLELSMKERGRCDLLSSRLSLKRKWCLIRSTSPRSHRRKAGPNRTRWTSCGPSSKLWMRQSRSWPLTDSAGPILSPSALPISAKQPSCGTRTPVNLCTMLSCGLTRGPTPS
uniref:Uncharacterized protein n=1 Tax=Cacopsylla melanoneura TaxID=428564 RepID=A0A8D8TUG0_9HEMI